MGSKTKIEWTSTVNADGSVTPGATWNPTRGCSRVSPGCGGATGVGGCYAERQAIRMAGPGQPYEGLVRNRGNGPRWTGKVVLAHDALDQPLRWRAPKRVFVNSMSDLFHEGLSNEDIAAVFGVMAAAPQHTFQVLTKRAERMRDWFGWVASQVVLLEKEAMVRRQDTRDMAVRLCLSKADAHDIDRAHVRYPTWPLPHLWLGVSVEDQQRADERIPLLLQTPAAVRFISAEPLLGPVDLERISWPGRHEVDVLRGGSWGSSFGSARQWFVQHSDMTKLDWVIAGAESGPGARPMSEEWVRSLRDQCAAAGVAYFLKQTVVGGKKVSLPVLDGKQHAAFPEAGRG